MILPFARSAASGMDLSTLAGARKNRALVKAYWQRQGYYRIAVEVIDCGFERKGNRKPHFGLRSNMRNGLPPGERALI